MNANKLRLLLTRRVTNLVGDLVDEIIARFRTIGFPVIRADRRCGPRQLVTNVARLHANGNLPQQLQDHNRKRHGSLLQLNLELSDTHNYAACSIVQLFNWYV